MSPRTLISTALLGLLLPLDLAHAHNGRIALAYPLEEITIDGDFSDWPDDLRTHTVSLSQYGDTPDNTEDLQASFRVAYSRKKSSLLVAVEVIDQSIILDPNNYYWESQDGCEMYVDVRHSRSSSPGQYRIYGDHVSADGVEALIRGETTNMEAAAQHGSDGHRYEWRIQIEHFTGEAVVSGTSVGLDVAVLDKDDDGSFSWLSWGPWTEKV